MAGTHWLGVDLGGTKILAGVFDERFKLLARHKAPTEAAEGVEAVCDHVHQVVRSVLHQANLTPEQVRGLGMGIPGQIDPNQGVVRYAPNLKWTHVEIGKVIQRDWTWPCWFENDVKLGTYGEFTHGAARGARHVLGIFVGTGIGGGLIINGEIYNGFNFCAGEIGHTIIHWRRGVELEAVAGRLSLARRLRELLADAPKRQRRTWKGLEIKGLKSSVLADKVRDNDPIAVQLVHEASRALGASVGSMVNLIGPEVIVLGGGLAGALGESFLEHVWEVALRYTLPHAADGIRFVPAELKDDSGICGAAAFAAMKAAKEGK